jgi:hypothetical protein
MKFHVKLLYRYQTLRAIQIKSVDQKINWEAQQKKNTT